MLSFIPTTYYGAFLFTTHTVDGINAFFKTYKDVEVCDPLDHVRHDGHGCRAAVSVFLGTTAGRLLTVAVVVAGTECGTVARATAPVFDGIITGSGTAVCFGVIAVVAAGSGTEFGAFVSLLLLRLSLLRPPPTSSAVVVETIPLFMYPPIVPVAVDDVVITVVFLLLLL